MTASKISSLEAKKLFASFEVTDASVQQTAGTQSFFSSPSKVVFYRYYAIYELSLRAAVINVIPFDPENSGASITIIRFYVGQVPGPESPCIVSFPSARLYQFLLFNQDSSKPAVNSISTSNDILTNCGVSTVRGLIQRASIQSRLLN